jgi:hypothetical protein
MPTDFDRTPLFNRVGRATLVLSGIGAALNLALLVLRLYGF